MLCHLLQFLILIMSNTLANISRVIKPEKFVLGDWLEILPICLNFLDNQFLS
jgi:hypothetical protein